MSRNMRHAAGVAILALAMTGAGAADQDKKPKGKPAAAQEQPAKPADQGKAKDKKPAQPAAGHGSNGVAGAGACTPDTTPPGHSVRRHDAEQHLVTES